MQLFHTPALVPLDVEVARLHRPRAWADVQAAWAGEPLLAAPDVATLVERLRGTGAATDPLAAVLVARAGAGDHAALTVLLAALAGVFVVAARRRGGDVDGTVVDQLSLATEVITRSSLPSRHVLATVVSRVAARHRRLRHRTRVLTDRHEELLAVPAVGNTESQAVARVEVHQLGVAVRHHVGKGTFTADDWRRLVQLRVHGSTSALLARQEGLSGAAVRKRIQRTADALAAART